MPLFWVLITIGRTVAIALSVAMAAWIWGIPTMWAVVIGAVLVGLHTLFGVYMAWSTRSE